MMAWIVGAPIRQTDSLEFILAAVENRTKIELFIRDYRSLMGAAFLYSSAM